MRGLLLKLGIPALIVLTLPTIASSQKDGKAQEDVFGHERLCVSIWPEKPQINATDPFDVKLRVVNASHDLQSLTVWSCSFQKQWKCSNLRLGPKEWVCASNYLVEIKLKPGEAYEKKLAMRVYEKRESKTESFKLGFTPHGEQKIYWSNEVVLGVE